MDHIQSRSYVRNVLCSFTPSIDSRAALSPTAANGQMGLGTYASGDYKTTLQEVLGSHKFGAIEIGTIHVCAIRSTDSTAWCW